MPARNGRESGNSAKSSSKRFAPAKPRALTRRELEVVEWIAAGKRNDEIGQILGCSGRTVQKHVQHILDKLDLETRTTVCVWWYEQRLDGGRATRARRKSPRRK